MQQQPSRDVVQYMFDYMLKCGAIDKVLEGRKNEKVC